MSVHDMDDGVSKALDAGFVRAIEYVSLLAYV